MEMYPDRVYSKPEFTALPPYLFSGADFALIPSRDEPFGLVAVEFGRKGALGVGSRLGGLDLMPGWVSVLLSSAATWAYAITSAAAFCFFGLNFGEEAGAATEVWMLRACIVRGSQQVWVAALWYWGYRLDGVGSDNLAPWWIVLIVWPLAAMSFLFCYLMLYGLPGKWQSSCG